ncbi:MAG: divergent polysaccharide deacetylase family protein [Pseudomonadales bacterium]
MRPGVLALIGYLVLGLAAPLANKAAAQELPIVVIIMDDLGYNRAVGMRALSLQGNLTYAILPNTPSAEVLARHAHASGKEVIVHAPMASAHRFNPGPGALSDQLGHSEFLTTVRGNIRAIPHARGMNNHMGSALTPMPEFMGLLMAVVAENDLYFIDSRTTATTVAASIAEHFQIKHLSRDVFIDHDPTMAAIDAAFQRLLTLARRNGIAVGIAHPYPTTLQYLETVLPNLHATEQVQLLSGSDAIAVRYASRNSEPKLAAKRSTGVSRSGSGAAVNAVFQAIDK